MPFLVWAVYKNPSDYPNKYVARLFEGEEPTSSVIITDNLDTLRDILAVELHLTCLSRSESDDPVIVETWLKFWEEGLECGD